VREADDDLRVAEGPVESRRRPAACDQANWTDLVPHFPDKTVQQITERWSMVLNPGLVKGSWMRQEGETIIEFVHQAGTKNWIKLARLLPGSFAASGGATISTAAATGRPGSPVN
jgi:hypothetical protein